MTFFFEQNPLYQIFLSLLSLHHAKILAVGGAYRATAHVNLFRWSVTVRDACISCRESTVLPPPHKLCTWPARSAVHPPSWFLSASAEMVNVRTTFALSGVRKGIISILAPSRLCVSRHVRTRIPMPFVRSLFFDTCLLRRSTACGARENKRILFIHCNNVDY